MNAENGKIYYYNRLTKKSEYKKPRGFDGVDIKEKTDNEYTRTFQTFTATPLDDRRSTGGVVGEGKVGKWEEVPQEESFFVANSTKKIEEEKTKEKQSIIYYLTDIDQIPEGEIAGEMHSDIDKYEDANPGR